MLGHEPFPAIAPQTPHTMASIGIRTSVRICDPWFGTAFAVFFIF
jgi:hypothetical protein